MLMTYGDAALATAHTAPLARYASYLLGEHNRTGLARLRTGYGDWQPPPPLVPNQNFSGPQGTPLVSAFSLLVHSTTGFPGGFGPFAAPAFLPVPELE